MLQAISTRRSLVPASIAFTLAVLVIYLPSLDYGFSWLDDAQYVSGNREVITGLTRESIAWAFSSKTEMYWHPLTWLSHMIDCEIYGLNPHGHRLTNLIVHLANTLLLFLLLNRLTGAFWRSFAVAALFALHPLNVESVVWISSRKNLLSTFFWMLTLWTYSFYAKRPRYSLYFAMLFFVTLGLMAKPTLVTLPFILIALDYWPLGRLNLQDRYTSRALICMRLLAEKLPFFALSAGSIWISFLSATKKGLLVSGESVSLSLRIENGLVSYPTYLYKTLFPSDLAVFYPFPIEVPGWKVVGAALLLLTLTGWSVWKAKRFPFFLMGWTWYLVTLLPVIGLVQQGLWPAWADRFAYIPLIGFFIMLSWGIPALVPTRKIQMGLLALFCFAALPMLAFSTRQQISYWRDNDGLLRHTIEVTERNHLAHYNLAHILASKGRIEEAILHYSEALKILPENAVFHHDLASVLISKGMVEEAVHHFKEAIRISPDSPEILTNLGSTLRQQGRLEEAFSYLVRAVAIRPIAEAHHNLGLLYTKKEMLNEAIYHYRESLKMRPVDPRIHSDLGIALNFAGEREEALFHLLEAVKLAPENPLLRHNLNMLLQLESESISADGKSDGNPAQGVRP